MTGYSRKVKASGAAALALGIAFSLFAGGSATAQTTASSPAKAEASPEVIAEAAAAKEGTITRSHGWEVRYGIANSAGAALERLVGKAESFAVDLFKSKDGSTGENRILGVGEAQGVFAVSPEAAAAVVVDYPNIKAISPRAREARVIESSSSRWYVYEDIGINFMGISIGYKLEAETWREALPDGAIGIRCRLAKSLDGKLYAADASWYFREVKLGGVSYTYIRTWSTSGLRNPGVGVAGVMKLFTAGELSDQVKAVAAQAAKR